MIQEDNTRGMIGFSLGQLLDRISNLDTEDSSIAHSRRSSSFDGASCIRLRLFEWYTHISVVLMAGISTVRIHLRFEAVVSVHCSLRYKVIWIETEQQLLHGYPKEVGWIQRLHKSFRQESA